MPNKKEHIIENNIERKHCPTCDIYKELNKFRSSSNAWDKLTRVCKICHKENKNNRRTEHMIVNNIENKYCPTCDKWKELNEFNNQKSSWDGLARMCRNCITEYKEDKRKNDPNYHQKDMEYNEKYKSSGRRREVSQIRYAEKKDEIIKKQVAYNNKRYHEDIEFRITHSLRTRINKVVKLKDATKCARTIELISCTPTFLKGSNC